MESQRRVVVDTRKVLASRPTRGTMVAKMDHKGEADSGRATAFRELADQNLSDAYGLAYAVLRDPADARDAVHDAFVTAWERWVSLRDPAKFESWFKRILINTCRNRLSKASRQRTSDVTTQAGLLSPDPTDNVHDREALSAAMARLKPDDRIVLALRYYRDLKIDDIAAVLDIPSGTATSRLQRAHQRLRSVLEANDAMEDRDG
jgi:RNA polymerase sigma-70 factor (ECF subfamily)